MIMRDSSLLLNGFGRLITSQGKSQVTSSPPSLSLQKYRAENVSTAPLVESALAQIA